MTLPMTSPFEQGTAYNRAVPQLSLSRQSASCKALPVMVARVRAQGVCSARYPSPAGRCGCPQGCAPCFFPATGGANSRASGLAMRRYRPNVRVTGAAETARHKPKRGKERCKQLPNGLRPSVSQPCLVAVATHSPNKRSWVRAQALALRLSPRAIWPQARSLAWSATWPTARNSRHAADRVTAAPLGARHTVKAMSEPASGVAFFMHSGERFARLQRLNEEGTDHV